jgi:phosphotransferase system HPr (HPr) family protein
VGSASSQVSSLERPRLLVVAQNYGDIQVPVSPTIIGNIVLAVSHIGSIVKSARTFRSSIVTLTIYHVMTSDEQHSENLLCFKLLHFWLSLAQWISRTQIWSIVWQTIEQGCDLAESIPMAQNNHVARSQVGVSNTLNLTVANEFVRLANSFQSEVHVHSNGTIANGKSILSLLSLVGKCGTHLALTAQGCDANDAVAALAKIISDQSHGCGEAVHWSPKSHPTLGSQRESRSTQSPMSQRSDRSWKCGPRWASSRRGFTSGPGNERPRVPRGRWCRG